MSSQFGQWRPKQPLRIDVPARTPELIPGRAPLFGLAAPPAAPIAGAPEFHGQAPDLKIPKAAIAPSRSVQPSFCIGYATQKLLNRFTTLVCN
jgi:hypothetical protein